MPHDCQIEFPGLPPDGWTPPADQPGATHPYELVYQDLKRLGHPVPTTPSRDIKRADLLAHLRLIAGALLEDYAAQAHQAIATLPYSTNVVHPDHLDRAARGSRHLQDLPAPPKPVAKRARAK